MIMIKFLFLLTADHSIKSKKSSKMAQKSEKKCVYGKIYRYYVNRSVRRHLQPQCSAAPSTTVFGGTFNRRFNACSSRDFLLTCDDFVVIYKQKIMDIKN